MDIAKVMQWVGVVVLVGLAARGGLAIGRGDIAPTAADKATKAAVDDKAADCAVPQSDASNWMRKVDAIDKCKDTCQDVATRMFNEGCSVTRDDASKWMPRKDCACSMSQAHQAMWIKDCLVTHAGPEIFP